MKKIIGSHIGFKSPDYFIGSLKEAKSYGANTLMLYTGAPQNTIRAPVEKLKIKEGKEYAKENGFNLGDLVAHAPYLINMGNPDKEGLFDKSVEMLINEIKRVDALGLPMIVLHPGANVQSNRQEGIESIIKGLNTSIKNTKDSKVVIALETMAGKGTEIGITFEEIKELINGVNIKERIGVCIDLCHLFERGYDIVNKYEDIIEEFDDIVGIEYLKVIHINDSKNNLGDRKDRHQNIGKGNIGYETIKKFVDDPRFMHLPKILETPWNDGKPPYKEEIKMLTK